MATNDRATPEYAYWVKLDKWSFQEAALLLQGLDPDKYRNVRFNLKFVTDNVILKKAYKTYLILAKADSFSYRQSAHPKNIFLVAKEKDLPISDRLYEALKKQYEAQEKFIEEVKFSKQPNKNKNDLSTRERNVFLKALAIMSHIVAKQASRYQVNHRPNPYQISQAILEKAEIMRVNTSGLKSLNRKITEALAFLEEQKEYEVEY